MKLKKNQPHWIKEKYTCCVKCLLYLEQKWFSVAKIFQKVMKYFCSGRCPRVQRIFGNFLRILGEIKIRVALEHTFLNWISEKKMNIFLLWKIFLGSFWDFSEKEWWVRDGWVTWPKIKGIPKCLSPFELIQNSKPKANATESLEKERRRNPGCHIVVLDVWLLFPSKQIGMSTQYSYSINTSPIWQ